MRQRWEERTTVGKKAGDRARGRWGRIGGRVSKVGEKPAAGRRPKRPEEIVSGLG